MPDTEIRKLLAELGQTIETLDADKESAKERLNQLSSAIETHLNANEKVETDNLLNELNDAVSEFEGEHPSATALLHNIANTLSSMGI